MKLYKTHAHHISNLVVFAAFYVLGLEIALSVWSLRKGADQSWASVMSNTAKGPGFPESPPDILLQEDAEVFPRS